MFLSSGFVSRNQYLRWNLQDYCKWYYKTSTFRQLKTDTFQVENPAII